MSREAAFRKKVIVAIKKAGGHASPVESHETSPGILDVDCTVDGTNGHLELKVWTRKYRKGLRPSQIRWLKNRLRAGDKNLWMVVLEEGNVLVATITETRVDALAGTVRTTPNFFTKLNNLSELCDIIKVNQN